MDHVFLYAFLASVISSIGGLAGGALLIIYDRFARSLSRLLMGFSAGVLLSVTFFDILPETIRSFDDPKRAFFYVLVGVIAFYLVERVITSVHGHEHDAFDTGDRDTASMRRIVPLVMFGDTVHNFLDGVTVAVTFVASVPLGMATATSVLLHELPHEIADFTILLRSGMSRRKVFLLNFVSALVAPLGTVIAYYFATNITSLEAPLLGIAAGNLLYIAMTDLIPHLHHERSPRSVIIQTLFFILGAVSFLFISR